jgi:hypothetical protein
MSLGEYLEMFTGRGYKAVILESSDPRFMIAADLLERAAAMAPDEHLGILAEPAERGPQLLWEPPGGRCQEFCVTLFS